MDEKMYREKLKNKFIRYRNDLGLPKNITFGIEIEYENVELEKINHKLKESKLQDKRLIDWENKIEFNITEHNSYGQEINGEISSPILIDNATTWGTLDKVLDIIKYEGGIVTQKCGGHVNIGAHILGTNIEYWKNFLLLWKLYYRQIYAFSSGEFNSIRNNQKDCFDPINKLLKLDDILKIRYFLDINIRLFDKCYDICIPSRVFDEVREGNRIEFRIPNGTLSTEIWQNYINFFSRLVLCSTRQISRYDILHKINKNKSNVLELANLVFDNNQDKEMFLIQTLKTNKVYSKKLPNHIVYK